MSGQAKKRKKNGGAAESEKSLTFYDRLFSEIDRTDEDLTAIDQDLGIGGWGYLRTYLDTFKSIGRSLDLDVVLDEVLDASISVLKADRGFLVLYGKDQKLEFKVARNKKKQRIRRDDFKVSLSFLQETLKKRKIVHMVDVMTDEDYSPTRSIEALNLKSVVCCPMFKDDELIGLVYTDSCTPLDNQSSLRLQLFQMLCEQAAFAINNAQLYEKARVYRKTG